MTEQIEHVGIWAHRLNPECSNPREQVFARKWQEEQQQYRHTLRALLCRDPKAPVRTDLYGLPDHPYTRDQVTQQEATAVATVIQWLGSNVGFCFLEECLKECGFKVVRSGSNER